MVGGRWRGLIEGAGDALTRVAREAHSLLLEAHPELDVGSVMAVRRRSIDALEELEATRESIDRATLARVGLYDDLRDLVGRFSQTTDTYCRLELGAGEPPFPAPVQWALHVFVDEVLEGLVRGSRATGAVLTLRADARHVTLSSRDDGIGILARQGTGWRASPMVSLRRIKRALEPLRGGLRVANVHPRGLDLRTDVPLATFKKPTNSLHSEEGIQAAQNE